MHLDPVLPRLVAALWVVVGLAMVGRRLGQPMPVVYILAGVVLGPFGLAVLDETDALTRIGEYGVILLLFLLGAEIRLERLLAAWRTPVVGLLFASLLFALTVALFAALCGLSAAFGAFVAGVLVGATEEESWIEHSLHPLRVVLVAVFLAAVGTLLDVDFLFDNLLVVGGLALLALGTNTWINAGILWVLGRSRREALLGGALLSQVGEFSFVLAAIGEEGGLITPDGYQLALSVIATTLLLSAVWITVVERGLAWGERRSPLPPAA